METCITCQYDLSCSGSYPTYEEWKPGSVKFSILVLYSSYPTYEEWKPILIYSTTEFSEMVLILPMRNGNPIKLRRLSVWFFCSYPTYEEWKQAFCVECSYSNVIVLILPMRNGNNISIISLLYLKIIVLILPMRNGNPFSDGNSNPPILRSDPTYEE